MTQFPSRPDLPRLMKDLYSRKGARSLIIKEVRDALGTCDLFFISSEQQDAHEALVKLLDILEESTKVNLFYEQLDMTPVYSSVIHQYFYGTLKRTYECDQCHYTTTAIEEFNSLSIEAMANVCDGIEKLSQQSITDKTCSMCNMLTSHVVCTYISQQPTIMILCVNRFHQQQNGIYAKNDTVVFCNPIIHLPGVAHVSKLVGMVKHHGRSLTSGHYTAVITANKLWYSCNDDNVHQIQNIEQHLHSKDVYLLFYVNENTE